MNTLSLFAKSYEILTEMLKGKSFENYVKRKLKDKSMERFRNMFFIQTK